MSDRRSTVSRAAAVIGHELRNPLAAAVTGAALACEMVDVGDPRHAVIAGVANELQRMSRLLDGYLAFASCGEPRREHVELQQICDAVVASRPGVDVKVADDAVVLGDVVLLSRVLENLVDNARQVGADAVRISAHAAGSSVMIAVEDDGPGVPAELRSRVFQPGFSCRGGTGLGLTIVAETVAAHGGSIRCEAAERGSRFVFELPAYGAGRRSAQSESQGLLAGA